ncbi:ExeA family protein [Ottowia beijingensis]|uniref:ExeA family protein n=2 Tax=Ottowia beijingensis TaxID=1207057 RepID=UPI00362C0C69
MTLANTLGRIALSQRDLARESGQSLAAINAIVSRGEWPKRRTAAVRASVVDALRNAGATTAELRDVSLATGDDAKEKAPSAPTPEACVSAPVEVNQNPTEKEEPMLLQNTPITPQALKHFKLPRSPFVDDVQSRDDVYQSPAVRYARAALLDVAQNHGFFAMVAESGAGKTTLAEELEQRLIDEGKDIVIIKPYVLAMEATDTKGKTLRATHIAEAIAYALDPQLKIKRSPQARFAQLHQLLRDSRRAGRRHLLLIEEAHCLPLATLKHLKRFLELKDGMQRVIGVALIAQPELRNVLHSQNPEVREVMQRCEVVELPPLDNDLEGYLQHKFARFDLRPEDVFEPDAFNALRARLIRTPRGAKGGDGAVSTCYPLAVHNLVARAMNAAAAAGYPKVDAAVVTHC